MRESGYDVILCTVHRLDDVISLGLGSHGVVAVIVVRYQRFIVFLSLFCDLD